MTSPRKRGRPRKDNLLDGFENLDGPTPATEKNNSPQPKRPAPRSDVNITTAEITFWSGYSGEQLSDLKSQGVITPNGVNNWSGLASLSALLKRLKNRRNGEDTSEDKARKLKAEANSAELKAMETGKETCLMSHAKQFWSDSRIAIRQTIERAEYISAAHREILLREIAAIKPAKLQQGNEETEDDQE